MVERPLYKTSQGVLTTLDVKAALAEIGICAGDVIFVHSDISAFGKMANFDRDMLLGSLVDCMSEAVGDTGTLIMPTFSYSFCKDEVYDLAATKSTVGVLTEFFRKQPGVVRTRHPIFSAAIRGAKQELLLQIDNDSFGQNSIFGKLRDLKGKIVIFGSSFRSSSTFLHYVEQSFGVSYRYLKTFEGKIHENGRTHSATATFLVRYLDRVVELDTQRMEKYLLKNGIMRSVKLGEGTILVVNAQELFDAGMEWLEQDRYFLLSPNSRQSLQALAD
ncbi:aminoglycoside 3-N-acetyltransferase [Sporomusaceae bacterium BoRhaA]|uniref:AAC(3) family N-acetyltransferase n=1 Tax=Pelorhabdus rhamnosifermentans TaxID=2772457 RepID=UPI001C061990|nr:AAC(3) family N-acetyltransferase [Pelorhabdus rhamnosifermentans]MBU2699195.1 aminoglycoside 3-N-acetyltransferase [Pelorhabdus rhamnosifermentans]